MRHRDRVRTLLGSATLAAGALLASRDADTCPQAAITGTQPCDTELRTVFAQASDGMLGPAGWGIHNINSGTGASETSVRGHVPCVLLSSVAETESSWHQFGYVACGASAPTLVSFDCGYGIAQITSGMDGSGGFTPSRVAGEPAYNVSVGVNILIGKWQIAPVVGNNDPYHAEDWYFALWGYNGFASINNPNTHPDTRGTYYDPASPAAPRNHYPYEEVVYGYALHPTAGSDGHPRWPSVMITHPNFAQICSSCGLPSGRVDEPSPTHAGDCSAAAWGGQFVMQSFPYASAPPITMHVGDTLAGYIEMRNIGSHAWDSNTRLATTGPRDRSSPLAGSDWVGPNRPAQVTGTVAPNGTFRFNFNLHANAVGSYDEHFGMVEESVAWFSDPGQAGPPDNQLEIRVDVLPAVGGTDSGTTGDDVVTADDVATSDDVVSADDAVSADVQAAHDAGVRADAAHDGGTGGTSGGCGCAVPARRGSRGEGALGLLGVAAVALWRRRRR